MQPRSEGFEFPGVTPSRQKRSREMTAALLQAGADMLRTRSLAELSIEALCTNVGATVGAFYSRFESKEAYFNALIELAARDGERRLSGMTGSAQLRDTGLAERCRLLVHGIIGWIRNHEGVLRAALQHDDTRPDRGRGKCNGFRHEPSLYTFRVRLPSHHSSAGGSPDGAAPGLPSRMRGHPAAQVCGGDPGDGYPPAPRNPGTVSPDFATARRTRVFPGSANQNVGESRKHPACARSLHPGYGRERVQFSPPQKISRQPSIRSRSGLSRMICPE